MSQIYRMRRNSSRSSIDSIPGSMISDDDDCDDDSERFQLRRSDSTSSVSFLDVSKLLLINDFDFGWNINNVSESTKKKFNEMKTKTKLKFNTYNSKKKKIDDLKKFTDNLNNRLLSFDAKINKQLQSSATEKGFYAAALTLIAFAGFIIGKYPTYFPVFHTVLFTILMPVRFYTYFKLSYNYYLADLCYYVNLLVMLFIWVFPDSPMLLIAVFSLSLGTLAWAVITWRNSLVLHSIEKTTSSFIHIMPPISLFVIVHELPYDYQVIRFPAVILVDQWNFSRGIFITSIFYTIWQVGYHYFITIRKKDQIEKGKVTSFSHLKNAKKNSPLGKFVNGLPYNWMQILAFTLIQFGYQVLTMVFCPIWYKHKHLCAIFVTFIFAWASYNGATYYIDVFGKRYEKEVNKLKLEIKNLQSANERFQYSPLSRPESLPDHFNLGNFSLDAQSEEDLSQPVLINENDEHSAISTGIQKSTAS